MEDEGMLLVVAMVVCINVAASVMQLDGRTEKKPATNIWSIRNNTFAGKFGVCVVSVQSVLTFGPSVGAESCSDDGWYRRHLRVSGSTFNQIVSKLTDVASQHGHRVPASNAYVNMRMRVAMTLAYLSDQGGFKTIACMFGVSKERAVTNINQVSKSLTYFNVFISSDHVYHLRCLGDGSVKPSISQCHLLPKIG